MSFWEELMLAVIIFTVFFPLWEAIYKSGAVQFVFGLCILLGYISECGYKALVSLLTALVPMLSLNSIFHTSNTVNIIVYCALLFILHKYYVSRKK